MGRPDLRRIAPDGERRGDDRQGRPAEGRRGRDRGRKPKESPETPAPAPERTVSEGDIIEGVVTNTTDYGAFVELTSTVTGLIHISELSEDYVRRVEDVVRQGDRVTVEVLKIDERGRYKLRRVAPETEAREPVQEAAAAPSEPEPVQQEESFEDRW
ncbi:MAG: S1 RNA-binding domain-containing protein [Candidatus Bipolaricaulota bacterium]|nr:MAG: S1 RNA-binding domain-containing protein [Candidatus Bipolaricaulota bacterium]